MRDYEELVERLHKRIASTTAGSPLQDDLLEAADAIEELQTRIDRAVGLYNRNVEKAAMYEALIGISPEPPEEEKKCI